MTVYCGSDAITATALTGDGAGGGGQQGWKLRDIPGLLVDAAHVSGRADASARKQSGTVGDVQRGLSVPLHVGVQMLKAQTVAAESESEESEDDDLLFDDLEELVAEDSEPASQPRPRPPARPTPAAWSDGAVTTTSAVVTPSAGAAVAAAGEVAVAARAAALREARTEIARAQARAEQAERQLKEAASTLLHLQETAAVAAQKKTEDETAQKVEVGALRVQVAAAKTAEAEQARRLARLSGDEAALAGVSGNDLKALKVQLESALQAVNGRMSMALIAERLQPDLLCPITQMVMVDPVVCCDGNSYERSAIASWLKDHDSSPLTGERLDGVLLPNTRLRAVISELGLVPASTGSGDADDEE